nr:DNA damage response protein DdrC [Deinobacterium chartae]
MQLKLPILEENAVRVTPEGRLSVHDLLRAVEVPVPELAWTDLLRAHPGHTRGAVQYDFGEGPVPVLPKAAALRVLMVIDTPRAAKLRDWMSTTLLRLADGDVTLAAEIAERNPDPRRRRWLSARLDGLEARKTFMARVAEHGGSGAVFRQVSSISNRSVLGLDSTSFRALRGVRDTRDGMTREELARMTYLEIASAEALEASGARGNDQILEVHQRVAERERALWQGMFSQASD